VHVQRRACPARRQVLDDREAPGRRLGGGLERGQGAEEPEALAGVYMGDTVNAFAALVRRRVPVGTSAR
jgi:hypothetical protein